MSGTDSSFSGYKIKRGKQLTACRRARSAVVRKSGALYAYPREKSIQRFKDQVRALTRRRVPLKTKELIEETESRSCGDGATTTSEPTSESSSTDSTAGSCGAFWSHRFKRWRNGGWRLLPETKLYGEYGLVNLIQLIPSLAPRKRDSS